MPLPPSEQEVLAKLAADFAAQIKAEKIKTVPRIKSAEARSFMIDQLVTVHSINPRLFGSGMTAATLT